MEHNNFIFVVWSIIFLSTYKVDVLGSPDTTGPPGGAPSPPPTMSSEYWFHQKLDHFNVEDSRYWKQRYYVFDEFYKPGGPAFLTIGGEGALGVYVQEGAWMDYIQTYHAIGFAVEHRYYGESRPTPDLSTANLEYLTIEQVLEDVASFIVGATKEHNLADTKWVTFGGSYAGMLSAYVRYKFPHLVAGAIASSAPVAVSVFAPEFIVSIGESLRFVPGCYQAVADAFNDARQHLKDDTGAQHLQSLFRLCAFDYTNQLDAETMLNGLMSPIINTAQYSNDNMGYMTGRQLSVSSMCRVMTDTSRGTALVRLADYHAIVYNNYTNVRAPCDNVTFTFLVNNAKNVTYKGGDIALDFLQDASGCIKCALSLVRSSHQRLSISRLETSLVKIMLCESVKLTLAQHSMLPYWPGACSRCGWTMDAWGFRPPTWCTHTDHMIHGTSTA
ncbi:putative serine protease K12H4.7 isoform X2 [Haliotis asinina]|uniref:putative serine protease K12H4.7 isoform X2 n=1 Tax=Haliotis asinina TaxID=109174 RepID=UPI003531CF8C